MKTLMILALAFFSAVAQAQTTTKDGIKYAIKQTGSNAATAQVIGYNNASTLKIPASFTYNGLAVKVINIAPKAFYKSPTLTSVTIPANVTIGASSFEGCSNLKYIDINASCTIGDRAFASCSSLSKVIIEEYRVITAMPKVGTDVFANPTLRTMKLTVPNGKVDLYSSTAPWNMFLVEDANGNKRCGTPEVSFKDGKVCATTSILGAECNAFSTAEGEGSSTSDNISISGAKLIVTAYVTYDDYTQSITVKKEYDLSNMGDPADLDGDGEYTTTDVTILVDKVLGK